MDSDKKIDSDLADAAWAKNTDPGKGPVVMLPVPAPTSPLLDGEMLPAPTALARRPDWSDVGPEQPWPVKNAASPIDIGDFARARARREWAEAELVEIELAAKKAAVLDVDVAKKAFRQMGRIIARAREYVPCQLAPLLLGKTDPKEIEALVNRALKQADERAADEIRARFPDVAPGEGGEDGRSKSSGKGTGVRNSAGAGATDQATRRPSADQRAGA
jgi:hypothetical protein